MSPGPARESPRACAAEEESEAASQAVRRTPGYHATRTAHRRRQQTPSRH